MFRISRIRNLTVTGETFTRRAPESIKDDGGEQPAKVKPVTLKLRFKPEDLFRVYDDYDENRIARNADGTYDVTVTFPEGEWVYGYIQSFGPYVEVLEPPRIRKLIRERLEKTLTNYQK
jgi:predicted DNA-binding transcriptional regulator YafY